MSDNEVKIARSMIVSILSSGDPTPEAVFDLYNIKAGDDKLLLRHLKAVANIMSDVIKILEGGGDKDAA